MAGASGDPVQLDLFRQGQEGVHTYRIPALIETRKGTLLAMADARHESAKDLPARISLVMRRSTDQGQTWGPVTTVRRVAEGGVGDASLLLDRQTGRVWCFHAYGPPGIGFPTAEAGHLTGPKTLQIHAIYSDDDGLTWSAPADLTPQIKDPAWQAVFATSGTHFQTAKGRYLVPLVVRDGNGNITARNAYSDDRGRTWAVGPAIGPGTDESKAVELSDGTVVQNMRDGSRRAVAVSRDGGIRFESFRHHPELIDPSCNAGLAVYRRPGQELLVFTNAASTRRENLQIRISRDGGQTWPDRRTLHAGPAAYSTVVPLRDGFLGILYERGDKSPVELITFAKAPLAWVLGGP
jgi:sialidase-1